MFISHACSLLPISQKQLSKSHREKKGHPEQSETCISILLNLQYNFAGADDLFRIFLSLFSYFTALLF